MTIRDAYQSVLIELNKVQAPSILIDDFIYYFNKATQEYFNKRYNVFETDQQATDDLSRLNRITEITPTQKEDIVYKTVWECELPDDYVHILNCTCVFSKPKDPCGDCTTFFQGANKLDTSQASQVLTNHYMKPSTSRPYYYIIYKQKDPYEDPIEKNYISNQKKIESKGYERYGNSTKPIMQILCGNKIDEPLLKVQIAYLTAPRFVTLDQLDLDSYEDKTPVLEFQDYVVNEIIKETVKMVMENAKDARIQTFTPINQSVPVT